MTERFTVPVPGPVGSPEWRAARAPYWNASQAGALFGVGHDSLRTVCARKLGLEPDADENAAMARGRRLEPVVVDAWAETVHDGRVVVAVPDCMYGRGRLLASPDRVVTYPDGRIELVEVKTTTAQILTPRRAWWWQCQAQLACTDLERVWLVVFDADQVLDPPKQWMVPRDEEAIGRLLERVEEVMGLLDAGTIPTDPSSTPPGEGEVDLTSEGRQEVMALAAARALRGAAEDQEREARSALCERLGDARVGRWDGEEVVRVGWRAGRKTFDAEGLAEQHPELELEGFWRSAPGYRVLRVTGGGDGSTDTA